MYIRHPKMYLGNTPEMTLDDKFNKTIDEKQKSFYVLIDKSLQDFNSLAGSGMEDSPYYTRTKT